MGSDCVIFALTQRTYLIAAVFWGDVANKRVWSLKDSVVDIFKLFVAVTFSAEMLQEVPYIFVVSLKALLGISTQTSPTIHINELTAMLDGTMKRVI